MRYRPEVDGLRALAVVPVMLFHGGFASVSGGYVGVDVFFVISGYLITSLIASEKQSGTFSLIQFYERRARRILPALFLVMLVCLPFTWLWMLPSAAKEMSKSFMAVAAFCSNFLFWREGGYFETPGEYKPLLHTWSLAVEEQYYLLFPVFLLSLWRFGRRPMLMVFAAVALCSLALAQWSSQVHPQGAFYLLPTRTWELLLGASLALFLLETPPQATPGRVRATAAGQVLSLFGLLLIAYAVIRFDRHIPYPSLWALIPTGGAALIILCAHPHTIVGRLLSAPLVVGVGLISYSAYLWHQPMLAFARLRDQSALAPGITLLLLAMALPLAWLSWRYVEKPARNRHQIRRSTVFTGAGCLTAFFLLVGAIGYATDGLASRYSPQDRPLAALDVFEAGRYVDRRFTDLELRPFDQSGRERVLVVGDSFAQDVVNAAYEAGLAGHLQFSTHWIPTRCGNLFVQRDLREYIEPERLAICGESGWYGSAGFRKLLSQADSIWVASRWTPWEVSFLPQSVHDLRSIAHARVLVFGLKNFGHYTIRGLLRLSPQQRLQYRSPMLESQVQLNWRMRSSLPPMQFLDTAGLLCGPTNRCPLFTSQGGLISFDGQHFTRDGAVLFGQELAQELTRRQLAAR